MGMTLCQSGGSISSPDLPSTEFLLIWQKLINTVKSQRWPGEGMFKVCFQIELSWFYDWEKKKGRTLMSSEHNRLNELGNDVGIRYYRHSLSILWLRIKLVSLAWTVNVSKYPMIWKHSFVYITQLFFIYLSPTRHMSNQSHTYIYICV